MEGFLDQLVLVFVIAAGYIVGSITKAYVATFIMIRRALKDRKKNLAKLADFEAQVKAGGASWDEVDPGPPVHTDGPADSDDYSAPAP